MRLYLVFIFFAAPFLVIAQKTEKEVGVKKSEVPKEAKKWMNDAYEGAKRISWFYQTDGEKEVYEAKLKWNKQWHSVEFYTNGEVLNIEILLKESELNDTLRSTIKSYLEKQYSHYNITRIQIQYTGKSDDLEDIIDENEIAESIIIQYEIEFYGKNETEDNMFEGIFDANGNLVKKRIIQVPATDNIDF